MKFVSLSPLLAFLLTPMVVAGPLWAQTSIAVSGPSAPASVAQTLELRLIESDGPQAPVGSATVKGFTVEVRDQTGVVISGAAVVFRLPDSGITGTFADGTHAAVAYTDSLGRAHVTHIQWATTPGPLVLRVTAAKGDAHAGILIERTLASSVSALTPPIASPLPVVKTAPLPQQPGTPAHFADASVASATQPPAVSVTGGSPQAASHSGKTKWIIIAAIAVGAGLGAAMAMKGKSNSSSTTPTAAGSSAAASTLSVK